MSAIPPELDWIQLRKEMDSVEANGPKFGLEQFKKKCTENPLVPVGALMTVGALTFGLVQMIKQNEKLQQYAMRSRVVFQGLTFLLVFSSMGYLGGKKKE